MMSMRPPPGMRRQAFARCQAPRATFKRGACTSTFALGTSIRWGHDLAHQDLHRGDLFALFGGQIVLFPRINGQVVERPVISAYRVGVQTEFGQYASVNRSPSAANRSTWGVGTSEPLL
jgi:hypothetical protein